MKVIFVPAFWYKFACFKVTCIRRVNCKKIVIYCFYANFAGYFSWEELNMHRSDYMQSHVVMDQRAIFQRFHKLVLKYANTENLA